MLKKRETSVARPVAEIDGSVWDDPRDVAGRREEPSAKAEIVRYNDVVFLDQGRIGARKIFSNFKIDGRFS